MRRAIARVLFLVPLAPLLSGCALFDSVEGYDLSLRLTDQPLFSIETDDARWRPLPPYGIPGVVCRGPAALVADCCLPPAPAAPIDCQQFPMLCDDLDGFCAMSFSYDASYAIDLSTIEELRARRQKVSLGIRLTDMEVSILGDTDLPVRQMGLYVAPSDVVRSSDPRALFITEIPVEFGSNHIVVDGPGQQAFAMRATDFNTPFSLILSARMVRGRDSEPQDGIRTLSVQLTPKLVASF